ncbi:MAG TPA: flagellar biosynthetic protein FliO [Bryobacteraceae bacterium]|nr:flagellar biosynthetic protein FliO [Bryobacteraceae bacterium]
MAQQFLAVFLVLGLLGAALWLLRSRGLARFGGLARRKSTRHLESIARLPLTPHHSVHLVRVSDHAVLLALSPSGCTLVERVDWNAGTGAEIAQTCAGTAQ